MRASARVFTPASIALVAIALSCGGHAATPATMTPSPPPAPAPAPAPSPSPGAYDVCHCTPTEDATGDYRHTAKHVDLPAVAPQTISVDDILAWPQDTAPAADAPRSGREEQRFQIPRAYLENVYINPGDCDIHFEISQAPDPQASRVIVETPDDASYCTARQNIQAQIAAQGLTFPQGGNLNPPLPVRVTGMAFQDYEHKRGSAQVGTTWELHPAVVSVLPQ